MPEMRALIMFVLLLLLSLPSNRSAAGTIINTPQKNKHNFASASVRTNNEHVGTAKNHRLLPGNAEQNICGSDWSDAMKCGDYCPGGSSTECPSGETCYSGVMCPLPPTISPAPTRSPVKGFDLGNHDKTIIGYYASWQWYDRAKLAKPENMDFRKVTRVTYAFFQLNSNGDIWGTDSWADPRVLWGDVDIGAGSCGPGVPGCRCSWVSETGKDCFFHKEQTGLIWLARQSGAEVYPSIGGWTLSEPFSPMANNPNSRAKFVQNCIDLIKDYGFDGIDLDWEYPAYAAHGGNPYDTVNYNSLLGDLRQALDSLESETGKFYGLTAALPCGPSHIANIDIPTVSQYLTQFNLMTYDFHGSWDVKTGVNSPLFDQSGDPEPGWSVDGCVKNWIGHGAPKDRLNAGLGFYGRSFSTAKALGESHGGNDDKNWPDDEGTPQYFNIEKKLHKMTQVRDEETKTQIAYFHEGGMVSFDDEQSICDKAGYVVEENLNGFIIWELSGDVLQDKSTPLLDILNRKIVETNTNCADPYGPPLQMGAVATAATVTTAATVATSTSTSSTTTTTTTTDTTTTTASTSTTTTTSTNFATATMSTTSSTKSSGAHIFQSEASTFVEMARLPVRPREKKPEKPYRPPKVDSVESDL